MLLPAQACSGNFIATFANFPPPRKTASFNLSDVMEKMRAGATSE